jgi:hypothetical protein
MASQQGVQRFHSLQTFALQAIFVSKESEAVKRDRPAYFRNEVRRSCSRTAWLVSSLRASLAIQRAALDACF